MITNERIKTDLTTKDFDYYLPEELIAQHPSEVRDASRLMVIDKKTGELEHKIFHDIIDYLNPGDTLVINDSKVIPARLYGKKDVTGAEIEFVLLRQHELDKWEVMVRPGGACIPATSLYSATACFVPKFSKFSRAATGL